jgi:hypothetical protein
MMKFAQLTLWKSQWITCHPREGDTQRTDYDDRSRFYFALGHEPFCGRPTR